jgi:hypothetical protein
MPPWFIEKNIGIQKYKDDLSLSDEDIAKIAAWVDGGAHVGNPADMPPPLIFAGAAEWQIGQPDLIVSMPTVKVKANAPDNWTAPFDSVATGLTEDRYVAAVETREVNDVGGTPGRQTVGGRFVFHHASIGIVNEDADGNVNVEGGGGGLTLHEVGRNAEWFDPLAGKLLKAHSRIVVGSAHLHSNGKETTSHLVIGLKFFPKEYQPKVKVASMIIGIPSGIDIKGMEPDQRLDAYYTLPRDARITGWEPHLHAAGVRMCYEAIWGRTVETLSCAKYDGNWVLAYTYADDAAPLLPKGTILHVIGYADNSPGNKNVPDPRNWSGDGQRTVDNMFGNIVKAVFLTEEAFNREVAKRREQIGQGGSTIGCPLCLTESVGQKTTN